MTDSVMTQVSHSPIESVLAGELARGDVVLGAIGPMLGMLLANHDNALFSDEVVARVRAMVRHVAQQALVAQAHAAGIEEPYGFADNRCGPLAEALAEDLAFVGHCHALALEYRLAMQIERRNGIDPVVSPLLQSLIASSDSATARLAMALLAAQARFVQQQRRMELPLGERPRALFERVLTAWRGLAADSSPNAIEQADKRMRDAYDEQVGRLSLLVRATGAVGDAMKPALSVGHAGVALFLTALSLATGMERGLAAVSTNESQLGRLALSLRSAGLAADGIAEQFVLIHPEVTLPIALDALRGDRARSILADSGRQALD